MRYVRSKNMYKQIRLNSRHISTIVIQEKSSKNRPRVQMKNKIILVQYCENKTLTKIQYNVHSLTLTCVEDDYSVGEFRRASYEYKLALIISDCIRRNDEIGLILSPDTLFSSFDFYIAIFVFEYLHFLSTLIIPQFFLD